MVIANSLEESDVDRYAKPRRHIGNTLTFELIVYFELAAKPGHAQRLANCLAQNPFRALAH
jgi:hypothetical protein